MHKKVNFFKKAAIIKQYFIKNENAVERLDVLIARELAFSINQARELIEQGSVWDYEKKLRIKDIDYKVSNEIITVNSPDYPVEEFIFTNDMIYYEDDYLLIAYKPPLIPAQATAFADIHSFTYGVNKYYHLKGYDITIQAINRLDLPTSGLMLLSKDGNYSGLFHQMFTEGRVTKFYEVFTSLEGKHYFEPSITKKVISENVSWNGKTKSALTYVKYCGSTEKLCRFIAIPKTGRTHQIRQHFKSQITPIEGDVLYGTGKRGEPLLLCCIGYTFKHPVSGRRISIRLNKQSH